METNEKTKNCLWENKSGVFKIVAMAIGVLLVIAIIFGFGVAVGLHKARFSENFGRNYEHNFMGSRFNEKSGRGGMMGGRSGFMGGMMNQFEGKDLRNGHGLAGVIISIADNNIIVKDRDNKENTITVNDNTMIKSQRDDLKISDLKVNDQIVIMGNPGDTGVVNASLIRVFANNQKN